MRTIFVFAWARCPDSSLIHLKIRTPPPLEFNKKIYISHITINYITGSIFRYGSIFPWKVRLSRERILDSRMFYLFFFFCVGGGGVDIQNIFSEIQIIPLGYINFDPLTPDNTWLGFQQMYTINVISWYG